MMTDPKQPGERRAEAGRKKQALAIVTGPYQLLQIIWYASIHPEYEYNGIIKTARMNQLVRSQIIEKCRNSGIFGSVSFVDGVDMDSGLIKQGMLFLSMLGHYIIGQKHRLTSRIIREAIGDMKYDIAIVDSENSILGGAFIDKCDQAHKVVIMQEGMSDILGRKRRPQKGIKELAFYMIARMGYCNPGVFYILDQTRLCTKLSSCEELLQYKNFAAIETIFNREGNEAFHASIHNAFKQMDWDLFQSAGAVIFTSPLADVGGGENEYETLKNWFRQNEISRLLIKKHPREKYDYEWEEMEIDYLDPGIPAEIILSQTSHQRLFFSFISSCILDIIKSDVDYYVFKFDSIKGEYYNRVFEELKQQLQIPEERIIHLS